METELRDRFIRLWSEYFNGADLPLGLYYTDDEKVAGDRQQAKGRSCLVGDLAAARRGKSVAFDKDSIGCFGGRRYLGFDLGLMPNFEYFLSCGIPGQLEGERYKKTPELVRQLVAAAPRFEAPARFAVFKRWDTLEADDMPDVVIFFAPPDVLSGLYTLAGFDQGEIEGVIAPFGAGCATICQYPMLESRNPRPRAILGLFDVSARPCVRASELSFAVPMAKFVTMINNMEESFLITRSWAKVLKRIGGRDKEQTQD